MKEFIVRIGVLFPITLYAVLILLISIGCIANLMGATSSFYDGTYSKLCLLLLIGAPILLVYCQAKNCFRKRSES